MQHFLLQVKLSQKLALNQARIIKPLHSYPGFVTIYRSYKEASVCIKFQIYLKKFMINFPKCFNDHFLRFGNIKEKRRIFGKLKNRISFIIASPFILELFRIMGIVRNNFVVENSAQSNFLKYLIQPSSLQMFFKT